VLMIGTNNLGSHSASQIADGVTAIVRELNRCLPETKVLLLGIFPRDPKPGSPFRKKIKEINMIIAKLDDGAHVHYLDIGDKFLEPDGTLAKSIMPDYLHLSSQGYFRWAKAIKPSVDEMLKK
jgi:lysophospholipase L1-like esterase